PRLHATAAFPWCSASSMRPDAYRTACKWRWTASRASSAGCPTRFEPVRPRALVTQPIAASALERLRRIADVRINDDATHIPSPAEIAEGIHDCDALFCLLHDTIDAQVIEAGTQLRIIASMKITPSAVDLAAATARRLPVTVIPPMVGEATADLHMGLLLAVARRILEGDRALRSGVFPG